MTCVRVLFGVLLPLGILSRRQGTVAHRNYRDMNEVVRSEDAFDYFDRLMLGQITPDGSKVIGKRRSKGSNVVEIDVVNQRQDERNTYRVCHLALFGPITSPFRPNMNYGLWSYDPTAAALLAVHQFNNGIDTVVRELGKATGREGKCNVRFTIDVNDSHDSPARAGRQFSRYILGHDPSERSGEWGEEVRTPCAILGDVQSSVTQTLATLSGSANVPEISHASISAVFDGNFDRYPLLARMMTSVTGSARAFVAYLSTIGTTHLGILFVRDPLGSSYASAIRQAAAEADPPIKVKTASYGRGRHEEEMEGAVEQLQQMGYRHIIAILIGGDGLMMEHAVSKGMYGPGWLWFFFALSNTGYVVDVAKKLDPSGARAVFSDGVGLISPAWNAEFMSVFEGYRQFLEQWDIMRQDRTFREYFETKLPANFTGFDFTSAAYIAAYSLTMFDAVMLLGLSACGLSDNFFDGPSIRNAVMKTAFEGASGAVQMNPQTGARDLTKTVYVISNWIREPLDENGKVSFSMLTSAFFGAPSSRDGDSINGAADWTTVQPFNYSDFTLTPPPSLPPKQNENTNAMSVGIRAFCLTLSGLVLVLSLVCGAWRAAPVVRASQPLFLCLCCVGTFVMASSIVPASLQEPVTRRGLDVACMATPWLLFTGFSVVFSALFSKTWRINKIFGGDKFRRIIVSVQDVMLPFVITFSANVAVLTSWTIVAPLTWQRKNKDSVDLFGRPDESYAMCLPKDGNAAFVFLTMLVVFNLATVLTAAFQAYKARSISSEFSESHYIGMAIGSMLQAFFVGIPLLVVAIASQSPAEYFFVYACVTAVTSGVILCFIFVPKIRFWLEWRRTGVSSIRASNIRSSLPSSVASSMV